MTDDGRKTFFICSQLTYFELLNDSLWNDFGFWCVEKVKKVWNEQKKKRNVYENGRLLAFGFVIKLVK